MRSAGSAPILGTSLIKIIRLPQAGQLEPLTLWPFMNIAKELGWATAAKAGMPPKQSLQKLTPRTPL
jgi:hypothetical protein